MAFCLTGLLALSSCDLEFWEDDDEAAPEPMEMRGFFISADGNGDTVCSIENADVFLEGDESTGKLNISFTSAGSQFQAEFNNEGFKVIEDGDKKTIVTAYVSESMGSFTLPGSYYLASTTDAEVVDGETIFTGYWVGHAFRTSGNPVVLCPYVLVPRDELDKESCGGMTTTNSDGEEETSNGTDPMMVHMGLQKYLTQDGGAEFRACYNVFDDDGYVGPHQRMP